MQIQRQEAEQSGCSPLSSGPTRGQRVALELSWPRANGSSKVVGLPSHHQAPQKMAHISLRPTLELAASVDQTKAGKRERAESGSIDWPNR